MGLGVEVDQPDPFSGFGKRRAQVDRGRRFSDAAFLVDNCDTAHWETPFSVEVVSSS